MREILFRGNANGKWVEGQLGYETTTTPPTPIIVCGEAEWVDGNDWKIPEWYSVDPSTVGQYTGITDRKGNRIFEGDVIRFSLKTETTDYVVEWCDGGFVFRDVKIRAMGGDLVQSDADNAEIVRNIHDNADLLK